MSANNLNINILEKSIKLRPLSAEEEKKLIINAKNGNIHAQKQFLTHYIKYIPQLIYPCKRNQRYDEDDLLQEGVVGLMKALKAFNPEKGTQFQNFAMPFIKKHIRDYSINNLFCIRIPAYLKYLHLKIKTIEDAYLSNENYEYPSIVYLSKHLNTSEETIQRCLEIFDQHIFTELEEIHEI